MRCTAPIFLLGTGLRRCDELIVYVGWVRFMCPREFFQKPNLVKTPVNRRSASFCACRMAYLLAFSESRCEFFRLILVNAKQSDYVLCSLAYRIQSPVSLNFSPCSSCVSTTGATQLHERYLALISVTQAFGEVSMMFDSVVDIFLRFSAATVVGGLVGLNRELMHKPVGCARMHWSHWVQRSQRHWSPGA